MTFYEGPNRTVEMSPTQIVFSAPLGAAVQEMSQGNPALAALAGLVGSPNNSQLSNSRVPEFALPLGNMTSGRGVTGNQLGAELMKNTLKELAKGVLEQQVVTRDSDRNQSGQVKTTFTESDLRFTRVSSSRLSCQAAAVTYDSHGNYLNKIILAGMLDKGAPVENANPMNVNLFGGFDMNSLSSPSSGNSNSFGNSNPPGNPGSFGDPASLGNMFGGNGSGSGQGAPGANLIEQMQQVQKMLKDMDAH